MTPFQRQFLAISVFFIGTGVILGAMGAHALKAVLAEQQLTSYLTAVRYQVWMGMALALTVIAGKIFLQDRVKWVARLLTTGTLMFSGSIYLLISFPQGHAMRSILGPITPIGGTLLIVAFGILLVRILTVKSVD
ncbi:DUF423 domain-containing protein [Sanyastnella coralliicola]|uniref:DUF423 domain-containing protein n=1 Tax=Sanyastnella coralliicola TaxID=3069118 RepID=UPI0027B88788|nr:DUF423 domain-containing protein [Longitalea sp. SCSIO 12813]